MTMPASAIGGLRVMLYAAASTVGGFSISCTHGVRVGFIS
jgi:hypothetical protein